MAVSGQPRWRALLVLAALAAASVLPHATALIKENQLGEADWVRQFVGQVTHAEFAPGARPRVFVGTAANVVACLNLRDGDIVWRQVLAADDTIEALALLEAPVGAIVSLSGDGRTLRAWAAADGALLWEHHLPGESPPAASPPGGDGGGDESLAPVSGDKAASAGAAGGVAGSPALAVLPPGEGRAAPLLAVHVGGTVHGVSTGSGSATLAWSFALEGWQSATHVRLAGDALGISVVGLAHGGASLGVARIELHSDGGASFVRAHLLTAGRDLQGPLHLGGDGFVAALTSTGRLLCSANTAGGDTVKCNGVDVPAAGEPRVLPIANLTAAVLVQTADGVTALRAGGAAVHFPGATAASAVVHSSAGPALALAGRDGSALWAKVVSADDWQVVSEERVQDVAMLDAAGRPLPVAAVALGTFRRKDDQPGFRVLATLEDHTNLLLQQGLLVWARPEALAGVIATRFVELPSNAAGGVAATQATLSLRERLDFQILSLKDSVMLAKPSETALLQKRRSELSTKHLPTRDGNGFRRLLLLLTASGKLAALHNGNGVVVWSVDFGPLTDGGPYAEAGAQLLPWRSAHDAQHAPEVLVLLKRGDGSTLAATVNAHTGRVLTQDILPLEVLQVLEVPRTVREGATEQHLFLLVGQPPAAGGAPAVSVLPDTEAARAAADAAAPAMTFWQADRASGELRGWGLDAGLQAEERWAAGRPAAAPALLAVVPRSPGEPLHTAAKVVGDRSLKVKHLNPHALLVASGAPLGAPTPPAQLQLHVEILDAVTGRPLFRQVHQGCRGPVHGVVAEHWAVYSYWNAEERRSQLSVVELYEAAGAAFDLRALLFGGRNRTISAYAPAPLEVLRESFFWGVEVTSAAVTTTARGITSKFLLLGTASDQVYMMDKRFLDPRRPRKAAKDLTPAEQEERLLPFSPLLPLAPQLFATYSRRVARLTGIATAPAAMESTSHILALGLDLFYTRVAPAASFDGVADDFPFALLLLITGGLAGGAYVLRGLAARSDVKRKWE